MKNTIGITGNGITISNVILTRASGELHYVCMTRDDRHVGIIWLFTHKLKFECKTQDGMKLYSIVER
jgi:hypothetical protein